MNILIVANHYAVCSARYVADAFTRLGHSVKHVGPAHGRSIWGMQVPQEYVWEPDSTDFDSLPDLTIVMDSDPSVLSPSLDSGDWAIWLRGRVTVVWGVDNHVRDYRRPWFDHYFLAHKSVSVMDWLAREDMTWLPCAYDPIAFPPSPISWEQREYDVCMIGVMYPKRWELVNAMRAAGLKVLAGTGLVYEAYRDAYHNSRVALVSSACGDLPIRLFEGAGMGCAVLSDRIADLSQFELSPAVRSFLNGDAVEGVRTFLRTASHFDYPRLAAQWAQQHTWDARCQVVIHWLEARS